MISESSKSAVPEEGAASDSRDSVSFLSRRPQTKGLGIGLIGFVIAGWGAMCGIGGGLFAVPVLHYLYRLNLKEAITSSLALVFATTASATLSEAFHPDSRINWSIVAGLAVGSLVGAQLGFRASKVIPQRKLKFVFTFLLATVGVRLLGILPGTFPIVESEGLLSGGIPANIGIALWIGLGGGFVAPLLGIGGGLIAVPALMLGLPELGHPGARACSMAMGVVTSSRAMALYYRSGDLNLKRSSSLALGAAFGAVVGVQLIHIPGVTQIAEKMLAGTLLLVALRFGVDVFRPTKLASN
nr:probable membrane transporter protein YunE [Nerophis lumbriciformis]